MHTLLSRMPQLKFLLAIACLLFIGFTSSSLIQAKNTKPREPDLVLSYDHLGPLKIGMTPQQAMKALNQTFKGNIYAANGQDFINITQPVDLAKALCVWASPQLRGQQFDYSLAFVKGKVSAISVFTSTLKTDTGIALDDPESKIKSVYSKNQLHHISANDVEPNTHYWIVIPTNIKLKDLCLKFSIRYGKISNIEAGLYRSLKDWQIKDCPGC
ncbi:MAG: hypothetical protein K2X66_05990 [Cyanobacteria bacterium]|nr:hypothetical protein [Cyanobacteriota bacterium]